MTIPSHAADAGDEFMMAPNGSGVNRPRLGWLRAVAVARSIQFSGGPVVFRRLVPDQVR
jgi:hypothetical protein